MILGYTPKYRDEGSCDGDRAEYCPIEHLARCYSFSDWKSVDMVMLTAAFDCSQDPQKRYFVMAGFASSAERWAEFDKEWRGRLAKDGLRYFHMYSFTQCIHRAAGPFDTSWIGQEKRRRVLLQDLLEIVGSHAWQKFGGIFPTDSLMMFSEIARERFLPSLIATAGRLMWADVEAWRKRERFRNQAELFFEDGDHEQDSLRRAIREVTGQSPSFRAKQDIADKNVLAFTPLQASDILAYEIQKICQDAGQPIDDVHFRFPYVELDRIPGGIRMLRNEGATVLDEFLKVQAYFEKNPLPLPVQ